MFTAIKGVQQVSEADNRSAILSDLFTHRPVILFSWGIKGDNTASTTASTDLGIVKTSKGKNAVEVAVSAADADINTAYEDVIHVLSTKPPEEKNVDTATAQENHRRNLRTKCASPPLFFLLLIIHLFCEVR